MSGSLDWYVGALDAFVQSMVHSGCPGATLSQSESSAPLVSTKIAIEFNRNHGGAVHRKERKEL